MMSRVQKGLAGGVAGTVAVSLLELPNIFLNWFDPTPAVIAHVIGMHGNMAVGWALHLAIGVLLLGPAFGYLCPRLPTDTPETKGIAFAVGAFVLMMLVVFMFGDQSTFTSGAGFGAVAWMLITNVVFGIVMGNVYGRLIQRDRQRARAMSGMAAAH